MFCIENGTVKMLSFKTGFNSVEIKEYAFRSQRVQVNGNEIVLGSKIIYESSSSILQDTVSSIYNSLRTVAIVALLTILVYLGIRMVISSAAKDKAKYKQMLVDWLVAFIMLFILHYMMAFIIDISENLTNICRESNVENVLVPIPSDTRILDENGVEQKIAEGYDGVALWGTNFVGLTRYNAGLVQLKGWTLKGVVYTIMYIVLVIYIVIFTFQYLRRVLYMAFLTMIAPLVAITYPIDKVNDGKAQGFSLWLREYIFNALLQPIHYIIYTIIMGSVLDLVIEYPAYALVALGFMVPAEKFIRKMFGFEKAGTVGAFGGAAGAALLMSGIQKLTHKPHHHKNDDNGAKGSNSNSTKIRTISSIPSGPNSGGGSGAPEIATTPTAPSGGNGEVPGGNYDNSASNTESPGGDATESSRGIGTSMVPVGATTPTQDRGPEINLDNLTNNQQNKKRNKLKDGLKAVTGHYSRRMINGAQKMKPLRALRRGITYGLGAATLGAVGLAAGIASGDPSKALQYTAAGGMVGGNLGRNLGDTASDFMGLEGATNSFKAGYLGDEYENAQRAQYNRDFKNNVSNYDTAVSKVTDDGWKEMSKSGGIIDESLEYGINDIGTMCNIYKTKKELKDKHGMNDEQAQAAAFRAYKLSKQFGDYSSNSKTQENLDKVLKSKGYSGADATRMKNEILTLMRTYQDISLD